jgi:hypothetical protein
LPIDINEPIKVRSDALAACVGKAPAAERRLFARLEQAFADFLQVPYYDARTLRDLEQVLDDLADVGPTAHSGDWGCHHHAIAQAIIPFRYLCVTACAIT